MSSSRAGTVRLTVAQAIVRYLTAQYSEFDGDIQRAIPAMFGIFGHGNVAGLGQALDEYGGSTLPFYQGRNEQSMVHAAAGFAKTKRRRATLACTASIGPGSTNMLTGAAGATINRLPVLLLPSDYYVTRRQGPVLQQLEHPSSGDVSVNDSFRFLCRFFDRITRPEQLITALPEAMRVLMNPADTGAVAISLPQDIQSEAFAFPDRLFGEHVWRIERRAPDERSLELAADALLQSTRPLLIAGGGVLYSDAEGALSAFASRFGVPVAETFGGKGAVTEDAPFFLGGIGVEGTSAAQTIAEKADLVIAVGTRLTDFATGSHSLFQRDDVSFVAINVCDRDAHKLSALPIVADARETLVALTQICAAKGMVPREDYVSELERVRGQWHAKRAAALHDAGGTGMSSDATDRHSEWLRAAWRYRGGCRGDTAG